ncbi:T9SS type A sorting domain-containing protein [Ferruginibacter lapsinanis]|uniref:T9SS type A sorting domain-containing protein n=1 Tax=Ferruginibacter lapsinanis TaxID=563172 RepID=UPI001E5FD951|nr:T9SS type A sorting domain-containing protein [Ferruginibacter lapsinanis]UEG48746.1 T9SS type A sorting domain-containing protein [Ferruginibacter lapsinanis]
MTKNLLTLIGVMSGLSAFAQPAPFIGCPNVNTAILRSGDNSTTTNPVSIYSVNGITGAPTLLSGPVLDPSNAAVNLQINGLGLNTADGFLYGLYANTPTSLSLTPAMPFYRLGANAVAEQLGTIAGPAPTAPENSSIVSSAAGEMDLSNNYYFSATTGTTVINFFNPAANTFTMSKIYIGKLTGVSSLTAGNTALSPLYVEVTNPSNDALGYLTSIKTAMTLSSAQNTGLRDFTYNRYDNMLYAYVTYPDPLNPSGNYYGQMLKVDPATGILTAVAAPVILPFANSGNEVAGSFLNKSGNFLILFTDGNIYKATNTSIGVFNGSITLLNGNTGLPNTLRGDMASCGAAIEAGILPVTLNNFKVYNHGEEVIIKWQTTAEINVKEFIIQKSADGINWEDLTLISTIGNADNGAQYQFTDKSSAQTAFYRLAIVDKNGDRKFSAIRKITAGAKEFLFSVYPNPVKNILTVESQQIVSSKAIIKISDLAGRVLLNRAKKATENMISLDLSGLNKGVYFICLITEDGINSTQRFVKQ